MCLPVLRGNACTCVYHVLQVFQEAEKLASLRHPCVMGFYGIVTEKGSVGTVAEYICHGSLRSGLSKIKKKVGDLAHDKFLEGVGSVVRADQYVAKDRLATAHTSMCRSAAACHAQCSRSPVATA